MTTLKDASEIDWHCDPDDRRPMAGSVRPDGLSVHPNFHLSFSLNTNSLKGIYSMVVDRIVERIECADSCRAIGWEMQIRRSSLLQFHQAQLSITKDNGQRQDDRREPRLKCPLQSAQMPRAWWDTTEERWLSGSSGNVAQTNEGKNQALVLSSPRVGYATQGISNCCLSDSELEQSFASNDASGDGVTTQTRSLEQRASRATRGLVESLELFHCWNHWQ